MENGKTKQSPLVFQGLSIRFVIFFWTDDDEDAVDD